MNIKFWGVRGSIPTPGKNTVVYGGNTSCVSVEIDDTILIFDAGTGIRECGNYLLSKGGNVNGAIFISHTHWDHIQGFPFFVPAYIPGNKFTMYGPPSDVQNQSLKQIMEFQTKYEYFPISLSQLGADIQYINCKEGMIDVEGFDVYTCRMNHPVACLAYKIVHQGKIFIYGGDHEPFQNIYRDSLEGKEMDEELLKELDINAEEQNKKIVEFCRDTDVVSWDGQYTDEEYQSKKGWGHSFFSADIELAEKASIKHIILTHHEPINSDEKLAAYEKELKKTASEKGFSLDFAKEGMEIVI